MAIIAPDPDDVLRDPTEVRLIVASMVIGCGLALLPLPPTWLALRPDLPLLLLVYWGMHEPRRVGQTTAFGIGLLMDVADSTVLGVHGLAFTVAAFLAASLRVRVLSFTSWKQAAHVLPILLLAQAVTVVVNLVLKLGFPGWRYFLGSLVGALVWPALSSLLHARQAALRNSPA